MSASNPAITIVNQDREITVLELITENKGINTLDHIKRAMKASEDVAYYEENGRLIRITFKPLNHGKISVHIMYAYRYGNKRQKKRKG